MKVHGKVVRGSVLDDHTRCKHYHTERDIIAIKFACCDTYYPCFQCHEEAAGHSAKVWKQSEFDEKAVLCGNCGHELTINQYLNAASTCPYCKGAFNPGCERHYHLYFEWKSQ